MVSYKIQVLKQLEDSDYTARSEFVRLQTVLCKIFKQNGSFSNQVIYSEDFVCYKNKNGNKHIVCIWGTERFQSYIERARERVKI